MCDDEVFYWRMKKYENITVKRNEQKRNIVENMKAA